MARPTVRPRREERYRAAERAVWRSFGAEPTERWCRLERLGTTVRVQQLGDGPAVLFVHGASNASTSWAALAARLHGVTGLLLDRPGCGLSPALGRRGTGMAGLDVVADALVVDVLDALDLETAPVVATSFGGYFGLRAAAAHPDRVSRLALLGWTFGAPTTSTPLVMRLAMQPALGRLTTRVPPTEPMVRRMLAQVGLRRAIGSGRFGPTEVGWFCSLLRDTDTMRNELDATPRVLTLRGVDPATLLADDLLARVTAPTLVVWGDEDPLGDATVGRAFAARLPHATFEPLARAGHAPWIDEPDHVAARVGAFLGGGPG